MIRSMGKEKWLDWEIEEGNMLVVAAGGIGVGRATSSAVESATRKTSMSTTNVEVVSTASVELGSTNKCGSEVGRDEGDAMSIEWEEQSEVQ